MLRLAPRSSLSSAARSIRSVSYSAPRRASEIEETRTRLDQGPNISTGVIEEQSASSSHIASSIAPSLSNNDGGSNHQRPAYEERMTKIKLLDMHRYQAKKLLQWSWFRSGSWDQRMALHLDYIFSRQFKVKLTEIQWLHKNYEMARTYRLARARLWVPQDVDLTALQDQGPTTALEESENDQGLSENFALSDKFSKYKLNGEIVARKKKEELSKSWTWTTREAELDALLKSEWMKLTEEQRGEEMLRVRYNCARRLGWRMGYTSGFPLSSEQAQDEMNINQRKSLLRDLGSGKRSELQSALQTLAKTEEATAWEAWKEMDKATRREEEKAAWDLRDRSLIYVDDSARILGEVEPRWYHEPQKVGSMIFLPNVLVRLVRNTTTRHGKYDAFKATFRVPLSMHKHSLRSYLLAIYGLRTTWCRSAIYRAPITRSRLGQKRVGNSNRTFKKVEVGILEPFVFPEITPRFKQLHMFETEMKMMKVRAAFKMTGKKRWRSKIPLRPTSTKSKHGVMLEDDAVTTYYDGTMITSIPKRPNLPVKDTQATMFRNAGIPTKKRSRILRLVHRQRLEKEAEISSKMQELQRGETAQSSN